jgi:ABC-type nitrate/sulfonate/bicarbonate transport system substrate-binding protein
MYNYNLKENAVRTRLLAAILAIAFEVSASAETKLRVNIFFGPQNIPLFVAQAKGFFVQRDLSVEITRTPNSTVQREGLVKGNFEIVQSAVDNAVALVDVAKQDVVIVAGGSNGLNELMTRPELKSYDDIRGQTLIVDAPNTAYALVLYKWLSLKGLTTGDYKVLPAGDCRARLAAMNETAGATAIMVNPYCSLILADAGFKSWGRAVDFIGPYQGDGMWVMRAWANANRRTLVKYIEAIIEADRWARIPAHRHEAVTILAQATNMDENMAGRAFEKAIGPKGGLAKDARFDLDGFKNTLQIRQQTIGGTQTQIEKYVDLSFYERALANLR